MENWINNAVFYHIYPLGFCGAPKHNDYGSQAVERLNKIYQWIPHIKELGANAMYLGPVFESVAHGYDTVDYYQVDRRLGTKETLKKLIETLHANGIRVVLDGVFNHAGREFFAFKDLQANLEHSRYREWFKDVNFSGRSPYNDPFSYRGWDGCADLVEFNLHNHEAREYLFNAVRMWIDELDIDGIRLDAADSIDFNFLKDLSCVCRERKNDFWLMGEVVHGDYSRWVKDGKLDATTNYECYKGLWSSFNDKNFFEITYTLKRQFAEGGVYQGIRLYNFIDNHDVNRIGETLKNTDHIYPLYGLLFTIPGVPSIYYGSEFGIPGRRDNPSVEQLRPALELEDLKNSSPKKDLPEVIKRFAACRLNSKALLNGDLKVIFTAHEHFIFTRSYQGETVIIAVNSNSNSVDFNLRNYGFNQHGGYDFLNNEEVDFGNLKIPGNWLRIIRL